MCTLFVIKVKNTLYAKHHRLFFTWYIFRFKHKQFHSHQFTVMYKYVLFVYKYKCKCECECVRVRSCVRVTCMENTVSTIILVWCWKAGINFAMVNCLPVEIIFFKIYLFWCWTCQIYCMLHLHVPFASVYVCMHIKYDEFTYRCGTHTLCHWKEVGYGYET